MKLLNWSAGAPRANVFCWVAFAVILLVSSGLRLRGLDSTYITLWDESVHVNVVSNLIDDCCTPRLHEAPEGANPEDWMDSHVWLHKPPVPFVFNAMVARPWTNRLFGIRFGAFIAAQLIVVGVFVIGMRVFDPPIALAAATLMAFNHYTFELVQGIQFSGIPDLTLACALLGALYALLRISTGGGRRHFVAFGIFSGVAFLCKDGLALIPGVVLLMLVLRNGWRQHIRDVLAAGMAGLIVIAPVSVYLATAFPLEAMLEQQERVEHLLRDIDGWGRPLDYYWTMYLPQVTSPLLAGVAYVAVGMALIQRRHDPRLLVLATWTLAYLVVLSAGVSKIHNFIYPIVPALYLLIPAVVLGLWREKRYLVILAVMTTVAATAVILQFDLFGSTMWVVKRPSPSVRPALVGFQALVFVLALAVARVSPAVLRQRGAGFAAAVALGLVLTASVKADWAGATRRNRDYSEQMAVREAALLLRRSLAADDVVLVQWPELRKSHLYVKYWSGLESFEVTARDPVDVRLSRLTRNVDVFLLSRSLAPAGEEATVPTIQLRRLRSQVSQRR